MTDKLKIILILITTYKPIQTIHYMNFYSCHPSLRTADVFAVVASLPPNCRWVRRRYFSEGEKRRPKIRLQFAG